MFSIMRYMNHRINSIVSTMHKSGVPTQEALVRFNSNGTYNYEAAIVALNTLQSNAEYLRRARNRKQENSREQAYHDSILKTYKFINRAEIELKQLDNLSVIHVTGTKGKGSTCAYCESILRHHNLRTGFYSSPHLINVTERIRIQGKSIDRELFASIFWDVYDKLDGTKQHEGDMPVYFQMLTLVAFKTFIQLNVDVAIIEVGIGGEYDTTNVLRKVPIVGFSTIGLDHLDLLGNTIDKIAWEKAGIMKPDCDAFTVPQHPDAMKVLEQRSIEKSSKLHVISSTVNEYFHNPYIPHDIYEKNGSLAIELAKMWLQLNGKTISRDGIVMGLSSCKWLGRFQIIQKENCNYYLDGAHTDESINYCLNWFCDMTKQSKNHKVLFYNSIGLRNVKSQFSLLKRYKFDKVIFLPNKTATTNSADHMNYNTCDSEQLKKCNTHKDLWLQLNDDLNNQQYVSIESSVQSAITSLTADKQQSDVLITGSIHLIGCALEMIQEDVNDNLIN